MQTPANEMNTEPEVIYAVRRKDGELIGDYSFCVVDGPDDWTPAQDDSEWASDPAEFELVKMVLSVVATKTFPECAEPLCEQAGVFWGLCAKHAEEDDPEHFAEVKASDAAGAPS